MNILVLLKLVIDPDIPQVKFEIDQDKKIQKMNDNPIVISSYDENALEVALKLKDKHNFNVEVLTFTNYPYEQPIKKALAMGADKAFVLVKKDQFIDSINSAKTIASYIKDKYDLILTGYESADWGQRTFAPLLASLLNYNLITFAFNIEFSENYLSVYKLVDDGYVKLKAPLKTVVSITTHPLNQPRYPKVKDIMMASKKPVIKEENMELKENTILVEKMEKYQPKIECEIIEGKTPEEKARKLLDKLKEIKLL